MGRFRQIIIPIRARFRSIENVTDARLVPNIFGKASQGLLATPAPTFSDGPPRNDYPPEAVY